MTHLTQHQLKRLSSYALTRDGIDFSGIAVGPTCYSFATLGEEIPSTDPRSAGAIYEGNGHGQIRANAILDINPRLAANACAGLNPGATPANHPGCGPELAVLTAQITNAIGGDQAAQTTCAEEMVKIVARKNGLIPLPPAGNN